MCTLTYNDSPNAEEALTVLSLPLPPTKETIEEAAQKFLDIGVGGDGEGAVIIRSGELGAYVSTRSKGGKWMDAYWTASNPEKVVDVTGRFSLLWCEYCNNGAIGAGNSFLGGLGAGLSLVDDDVYEGEFKNFRRQGTTYSL